MKHCIEELIGSHKTFTKDDFVFFWGHKDTKGEINKGALSQWYPCEFVLGHNTFSSAEQYMMSQKAWLFKDIEIYKKILETTDPRVCKSLGRKVSGFDSKIWDTHCQQIVFDGNLAKFYQNEDLKKSLLATKDKIIVEASPYDHIWGIGMSVDNPETINPSKWKGQNLLGFTLMEVRDILRYVEQIEFYSGNKCPFCEKERLDSLSRKTMVIDHQDLLKPDLKPSKEDLEISEELLKKLVNKFNSKSI